MLIREAGRGDIDAVSRLRPSLSEEARAALGEAVTAGSVTVAAAKDGGIVGYVVADRSFFELTFVHFLFVCEQVRRRGIARQLLQAVVHGSPTIRVFVSTNLSNAPMHALLMADKWRPAGMLDGLDPGDPEVFYFIDRTRGGSDA